MKKIRVCNSRACSSFGAKKIMSTIEEAIGLSAGQKDEKNDLDYCGCVGWCSNSPNIEVDDSRIIMDCDPKTVVSKINGNEGKVSSDEIIEISIKDDFLGDI